MRRGFVSCAWRRGYAAEGRHGVDFSRLPPLAGFAVCGYHAEPRLQENWREPPRCRWRSPAQIQMDTKARPTDEELALAAQAGSRDAFEGLVRRFGATVQIVVEKQVGDAHQALDLTQEIWVKVFRALPRFRPQGSFRSWLFSIALNHVRDARRAKARARVVYLDDFRSPPPAPLRFDPRGRIEEHAAIEAALAEIPEPYRTAVLLVDVMDLTYDEVAATLDTRIGTVKSRVNRGRAAFRDSYLRISGEEPIKRPESARTTP